MEQNINNLKNKEDSNNNILLEIIKDLQELINYSKDDFIIISLRVLITKINFIINENKKNLELKKNDINKMNNKFNTNKYDLAKFNKDNNEDNINNQELKLKDGKYFGEVVNGLREGKGIYCYNDSDRYEGFWKKDKKEGKGIMYLSNGDRYEGDFRNDDYEGKGIYYYSSDDRYEGGWKNGKQEGKGIYYHKKIGNI